MRALERLKLAVDMRPARKAVDLPNGEEFEYWSAPITLAQRAKAQKQAGSDDATAFALQLLVMVACDEDGQKLFAPGEIAELRNTLPASVVEALMLQLLSDPSHEEDEELDMKSSSGRSAKGPKAAG